MGDNEFLDRAVSCKVDHRARRAERCQAIDSGAVDEIELCGGVDSVPDAPHVAIPQGGHVKGSTEGETVESVECCSGWPRRPHVAADVEQHALSQSAGRAVPRAAGRYCVRLD